MSSHFSLEQLQKLRCLQTGSALVNASQRLIDKVNRGIQIGSVRDNLGRLIEQPIDGGLTNAEVSVCYPIIEGIIQLLGDESIPLQQLEGDMSEKTIFKRIIDGEIPANIVYEDDECLAFHDVNAQAPVHVLVIPRKEIASTDAIEDEDQELLGHMWRVIRDLARKLELSDGYRVVVNCGDLGGQSVPHLHFHLLGGRRLTWPPG